MDPNEELDQSGADDNIGLCGDPYPEELENEIERTKRMARGEW